jgi:acyl-CoA dehydrogenase
MDFEMTHEQALIVEQVRRFVREEIVPLEAKLDPDASRIEPEDQARLAAMTRAMGLYGLGIPPEFGGPDIDIVTQTLIAMETSQHRAGLYSPCFTRPMTTRRNAICFPCCAAKSAASSD